MRKLSDFEALIIDKVAEVVPENMRAQLMSDAASACSVDRGNGSETVFFVLDGYVRPVYKGQHPFPVEIELLDEDGADLTAILFADENGRLFELELIRWDCQPVISPNPGSIRIYA